MSNTLSSILQNRDPNFGTMGQTGFTGSGGFTGSRGNVGFVGSRGAVGFTGSQAIANVNDITSKAIAMAIIFG